MLTFCGPIGNALLTNLSGPLRPVTIEAEIAMNKILLGAAMGALVLASAGAASANNILPNSGDTVTGSSLYPGFSASVASGNLINGTSNPAYFNTDPRWVFGDNDTNEILTVDLGAVHSLDAFSIFYGGTDRTPASFEILTSTGSGFTSYGTVTPTSSGLATITGAPISAQYVEFAFGSGSAQNSVNGAGISQLAISAAPEPAAWALLMVAVGMIGSSLRLRRRRSVAATA